MNRIREISSVRHPGSTMPRLHQLILASGLVVSAMAASSSFAIDFYPAGIDARCITTADINHDGYLDIVVAGKGLVSVLRNRRNGTFIQGQITAAGQDCRDIVAADLNGDQRSDVITAGDTSFSVLINIADGTLSAPVTYNTAAEVYGVALGDLDGDEDLDVAVATENGFGRMICFVNNGNGSFGVRSISDVDRNTTGRLTSIVAGDLDDDGDVDLGATYQEFDGPNNAFCAMTTFFNDGTALNWTNETHVIPGTSFESGGPIWQMNIGDIDGDEDLDLSCIVWTDEEESVVQSFLNDGAGGNAGMLSQFVFGSQQIGGLATGDLKNNGLLDMLYAKNSEFTDALQLFALRNNGDGKMRGAKVFRDSQTKLPTDQTIADINNDGALDSITVCSGGALVLSNPTFQFGPKLTQTLLRRGDFAEFNVTHAIPNRACYFFFGAGAPAYSVGLPDFGGITLNLREPIWHFGTRVVDADGNARLTMILPTNFPYDAITTQAIVRYGQQGERSSKSNFIYAIVR